MSPDLSAETKRHICDVPQKKQRRNEGNARVLGEHKPCQVAPEEISSWNHFADQLNLTVCQGIQET